MVTIYRRRVDINDESSLGGRRGHRFSGAGNYVRLQHSHSGASALMVSSATSDMPTAPAIKYLVSWQGYDIGEALPPLPELDEQERARLTCYDRVTECVDNIRNTGRRAVTGAQPT